MKNYLKIVWFVSRMLFLFIFALVGIITLIVGLFEISTIGLFWGGIFHMVVGALVFVLSGSGIVYIAS